MWCPPRFGAAAGLSAVFSFSVHPGRGKFRQSQQAIPKSSFLGDEWQRIPYLMLCILPGRWAAQRLRPFRAWCRRRRRRFTSGPASPTQCIKVLRIPIRPHVQHGRESTLPCSLQIPVRGSRATTRGETGAGLCLTTRGATSDNWLQWTG